MTQRYTVQDIVHTEHGSFVLYGRGNAPFVRKCKVRFRGGVTCYADSEAEAIAWMNRPRRQLVAA